VSRDWYQHPYLHADDVWAVIDELSHEVGTAEDRCPGDASGALVRLACEAKRELLSRLAKLMPEQQTLRAILEGRGVWEAHANEG
jgi:hypothetical protein